MLKIRLIVLSLLAMFVVGLVAVSAAAADPLWKVNGAKLEAGEKYEVVGAIQPGTTIIFHTAVQKVGFELSSKEVAITKGNIKGGEPGTDEAEAAEFKGVTVLKEETKCEVNSPGSVGGIVKTNPVLSLLVENTALTRIEDLWYPKTGGLTGTFAEIEFKNKGSEKCPFATAGKLPVKGDVVALAEVEGKEEMDPTLNFEPPSKEYDELGVDKEAKLEVGTEPATFKGEILSLITSPTLLNFGAFR
jgi:hypothetical protein